MGSKWAICSRFPIKNRESSNNTSTPAAYWALAIFFSTFLSACSNENTEGKRLYDSHCMNCHQEDGQGVGKLIPPIDKTYMLSNANRLGCIIKYGLSDSIHIQGITYKSEMPKNDNITDFDMVNILNYINEKFGSGQTNAFNIQDLRKDLEKCK